MPIQLDHLIVPSNNQKAAAERLATVLDVAWSETGVGPFCPVFVNSDLTLDFDQCEGEIPVQHYCFRLDDASFDQLLARFHTLGIRYRSKPHGEVDMQVNSILGGRVVYWSEPDAHVWEALTVSYARAAGSAK